MPSTPPDFHDQFILSRSPRSAPSHFVSTQQGEWLLQSSPTLPVTVLVAEGVPVGWMLGWAVLGDGSFAHQHAELALPAPRVAEAGLEVPRREDSRSKNLELENPRLEDSALEAFLYSLPGRWVCFTVGAVPRVYLDPAGSLALIFDAERQALASTTSLMNWADADVLSVERFERRTLGKNQFYPFGLTSDAAASRLLPNHYLSLSTWQSVRHWPRQPIERVADDRVADPIAAIVHSTERFISALSRHARLQLPLTAGRDSRMVMAMAEGSLPEIDFVTFAYTDWRRADATYARSLSRRLGLSHTELRIVEATDEQKMQYLQAIGYDAFEGKARDFLVAAGRLPRDRGWLTAFGGEVGRADYWDVTDGDGSAPDLLERLGLERSVANIEAAENWLRDTPFADIEQLYDLLSIEQRLGCWVGPQMYGATPFVFNIVALNQRAVFQAMLSLPVEYVRQQMMAPDVIALSWPDLALLPFKRRWGVMGVVDRGFLAFIRLRRRARVLVLGRRDTDMDPASRAWRRRRRAATDPTVVSVPRPADSEPAR